MNGDGEVYSMKPMPEHSIPKPPVGFYQIKEIFYSVQGEGVLAGIPMTFLRFSLCNLRCTIASAGFDCDTDFIGGRLMSVQEIVQELVKYPSQYVLVTGGEPTLQLDDQLVDALLEHGYRLCLETNGTNPIPKREMWHWVTVSPKSAWHTIRVRDPDELRVVLAHGMALPNISDIPLQAKQYVVSVRFQPDGGIAPEDMEWAIEQVKQHPEWRLSLQWHKLVKIR